MRYELLSPHLLRVADQLQEGSRALREAASLVPDHPDVKAAFDQIQKDNLQHVLHKLCSKFVHQDDQDAGKEALAYLSRSAQVPGDVAAECMELVTKPRAVAKPPSTMGAGNYKNLDIKKRKEEARIAAMIQESQEIQDGIISGLLRESSAAKVWLAKKLDQCSTNLAFKDLYGIGNGTANGIATVVLDPSAWSSEDVRETCEKDIFQLYLAKLLEVGDEYNGRALNGIARLLAADAEKLHGFMDEMCLDAVLTCLDDRGPIEVRSKATLATAKYLEVSDSAQEMLVSFVTTRIARQHNEDLVLAFSAAAGVFPVAPTIASTLFLTKGFLESLIPLVEKKAKSEKVEHATLNMLNAACIDTACREAIGKHCTRWLQHVLDAGKGRRPGIAAVVLAKCQGSSIRNGNEKASKTQDDAHVDGLVSKLEIMMAENSPEAIQSSIEGLAYASVKPKVKDQLAKNQGFLIAFLGILKSHSAPGSPIAFGGLTLIDNLTRYLPNLSEEQKRISQLKAYANASKPSTQADPLDEEDAVTKRCKAVVDAGAISVLVGISKTLSPGSIGIIFNILLSLSRTQSLRGTIAQQGGVRLLLQNYTAITGTSTTEVQTRHTASHALARILVKVDPALVFPPSGAISLTSAIRPLVSLLSEDPALATEGPRDLLPTFEALLSLTNLASIPSSGAAENIIRLAFPTIEDLLLNSNERIQRAATELVCNLITCPAGVELFADESKAAARRVHILLAMADVDDEETRKAAGGALASLTQFEGAVKAILARERAIEILLGLCEGDDQEGQIVHRGVVCIMNIVCIEDPIAQAAIEQVKELGGLDILKAAAQDFQENEQILSCAVQALRALVA